MSHPLRGLLVLIAFAALSFGLVTSARADTLTLNFDSVSVPSLQCVNATSYLNSFGITFTPITFGSVPQICNNTPSGPGFAAAIPTSPPNVFYVIPPVTNTPVSYALNFAVPLESITFTRTGIISISTSPTWTARAFNELGMELDLVGEAAIMLGPPPQTFTLTGPGITSLRVDANNFAFATFNHPPFDDLVLVQTPIPEPTTMLLLGTGLAGVAAGVRRRRKAGKKEGV